MLVVRQDDLSGQSTRALLALHLRGMHASSPPGHVFALDLSGLAAPDVTVWSVWDGETVIAVGALREASDGTCELKSFRTHPDHLRKGAAALLLDRIIAAARRRGLSRLDLETGVGPASEPALAFYRAHGFANGAQFGDYTQSAFNQFLYLPLQ